MNYALLFYLSSWGFSHAVVAGCYFCCTLSKNQLASQLSMLVLTVASGVFLKLYLDRHSGEECVNGG
jgi:hypothetical protein